MSVQADVTSNRQRRSWSHRALMGRSLWWAVSPLFRFSPRPLWAWRVWMLRCFGAQIGDQVRVHPSVRITIPWNVQIDDQAAVGDCVILYALGLIKIGARATVSQHAHLCAGSHDWRDPTRPLLKTPIQIGADAWVCADAFVGPGVQIGQGAVLGARSVAMKDLPEGCIGFGNPMKVKPSK